MLKRINLQSKNDLASDTIVFLHGNSSSLKVFGGVLQANQLNHKLLAMDLPGHGSSYRSDDPKNDYSIANYKKEILKVIEEHGTGSILLVGNSLGGHLSIELAGLVKNLAGLLIFGSPPVKSPLNPNEAFLPNEGLSLFLSAQSEPEFKKRILSSLCRQEKDVALIIEDFDNTDPEARAVFGQSLGTPNEGFGDEFSMLKNSAVQKFVIQGSNEPSVSLEYLKQHQKELRYELIEIPECGHYPTLDQPEFFLQHLTRIAQLSLR
tara:strand:- start:879 stop:1670 length:792 start_codon:yes stop_codon:yes gene_type:complete